MPYKKSYKMSSTKNFSKKTTFSFLDFQEIFKVSRTTLVRKLVGAGVYEDLKGAKVIFEDQARKIFIACGSDYDAFMNKRSLTNQ